MDRRITIRVLAVATLIVAVGCAGRAPAASVVEGSWTITHATLGGTELPPAVFQNAPLRLAAGKYDFQGDSGEY